MQIETMTVIQDGNEVVINKSDFNPEIHEVPGEPAVTTEQFFVTKSGKSFVITDASGKQIGDEKYDTEQQAWDAVVKLKG